MLLVGLYSDQYPAAGETHGLSVVAGAIYAHFRDQLHTMRVVDLVAIGSANTAAVTNAIAEVQPDILGLSVPYGTYDMLRSLRMEIARLLDRGRCVMAGGVLPTYIGERLLREIDDRLIVIVGEGEDAAVAVIEEWLHTNTPQRVPNTLTLLDGIPSAAPRKLVDPSSVPLPYRAHIPDIAASGAQIFVESSRACSWAACSFCLRGLTDIDGTPREYRRFPIERLLTDLRRLCELGVSAVTFADEDFLGGPISEVTHFVHELVDASTGTPTPTFDVSATIRSIFAERDDPTTRTTKLANLAALRQVGLRKVFLGVESGARTQLRRYSKGHTPYECVEAARAIVKGGIRVELGFIMFDPLCSLNEIVENVRFLLDNDLAEYVSGPTSELRLQFQSRYLSILHRAETELGRQLYDRTLDPNTLSYEYTFADPNVAHLAATARAENERNRALIYRLKGLTRFGDGTFLGDNTEQVRELLGSYRRATLEALATSAQGDVSDYARLSRDALQSTAKEFVRLVTATGQPNPMVQRALAVANAYLAPTLTT